MIPNLTKGRGITGAVRYCMGEGVNKDTGERIRLEAGQVSRAEILGGQNFGFAIDSAERVELARRIMEFNGLPENQAGRTRKCEKDCLHVSLSWDPSEQPSREEMLEAAQGALKSLGMERAQALFFTHSDTESAHLHIVASRIDPQTGKAFSDTRDATKLHAFSLQWEKDHGFIPEKRRALHDFVDAVRAGDIEGVVERLTERNPTFAARDLKTKVAYSGMEPKEVDRFCGRVLNSPNVIGLRDTADGPIKAYTSRDVLAAERSIMEDARALNQRSGQNPANISEVRAIDAHGLSIEQADALTHATRSNGFAMIAGQAGTGKSRVMGAVRDAYEADGYRVVGLAWTNSVVNDLRDSGFKASTIASELKPGKDGQSRADRWNERTIVMVDEAAMLSTGQLKSVMTQARAAGAKVILVGDDKQLGSVERGGMFAPMRQEFGAAEIAEVQRTGNREQQKAWRLMHEGEFRPAMATFERQGALHWTKTEAQAERDLVARYTADRQAAPDKSRFIFAHTNDQVDRLNAVARSAARKGGKLGADIEAATRTGPLHVAKGDRIQLTGSAPAPKQRREGFVSGAVGTVIGIEAQLGSARLVVQLDSGKRLNFRAGNLEGEFQDFRHGYAGTIYKGQGKSIDQTYVLVSKGWQADSSYVAMTRHKESVAVFTPRDVAGDHEALATLMGRDAGRRAASGYQIDQKDLARSGLKDLETAERFTAKMRPTAKPAPQGQPQKAQEGPQAGKEAKPEGSAAAQPTAAKAQPRAGKTAEASQPAARGVATGLTGLGTRVAKIGGKLAEGIGSAIEGLFAGPYAADPRQGGARGQESRVEG